MQSFDNDLNKRLPRYKITNTGFLSGSGQQLSRHPFFFSLDKIILLSLID